MKVPEPRKLESGTWFIQLRLNGVSVPITAPTAKECKRKAELIKSEHRNEQRAFNDKGNITLSQAVEAYIDNKRNILSPSTIRGYYIIKNNRLQSVADKPINKITNWQRLINEEAAQYSAKTVKNTWRFICSVLREQGITPPKVVLPQVIIEEHPYLDPEQIIPFVRLVKGEPCAIPALLALHSLRCSEILALDWSNVDLENELIHVRGAAVPDENNQLVQKKTNKNNSSRRTIQLMIPELIEILRNIPDKEGLLVTSRAATIYKQINRLCEANDLPLVGVHGLRHSFASLGFHVGLSEREVMEIGGWSDSQTVHKIYEHLAKRDRLKAENKMKLFYKQAATN